MQCFVSILQTRDKKIKNLRPLTLDIDLKRVLAYPLISVPLTFAHIDGLKMSTDKSTLFSKLKVGIIINAPRNIDAFIVDGMFLYSLVLICLQLLVVKQM